MARIRYISNSRLVSLFFKNEPKNLKIRIMKNNIEKTIHNWSTNIVRIGCLSLILLGTSEWLMHTSEVRKIQMEHKEYTDDQQVEFPLPILTKVFTY